MLSEGGEEFVDLPMLSCGGLIGAVALADEESHSKECQVLLFGGVGSLVDLTTIYLVDLATGGCQLQHPLLHPRSFFRWRGC